MDVFLGVDFEGDPSMVFLEVVVVSLAGDVHEDVGYVGIGVGESFIEIVFQDEVNVAGAECEPYPKHYI